jgi:hypothetical protein
MQLYLDKVNTLSVLCFGPIPEREERAVVYMEENGWVPKYKEGDCALDNPQSLGIY